MLWFRYIVILFIIALLIYLMNRNDSKTIWMYWETLPNKIKPGYIDLCINSVKHNCGTCFNIIILDNKNIYYYLVFIILYLFFNVYYVVFSSDPFHFY